MVEKEAKPEDYFEWSRRDSTITDNNKKIIYQGLGLEAPVFWSDDAVKIAGSKFFYNGDNKDNPIEKSVKQLVHRVANSITNQAVKQGVIKKENKNQYYSDLASLAYGQSMFFNSPVWFNVGLHEQYGVTEGNNLANSSHWALDEHGNFTNKIDAYQRPQGSACFIQSIQDNMESILKHAEKEGILFKYGSGTGTNFSTLRGINEPLSGGGIASGEISFLRIYDIIAGRIRSGGKTRRAAKMVITDDNHPDFIRFINWKANEEKKALYLSANPQWGPTNPGDLDSEAYKTVDGQNGNNSVRLTDEFMEAALARKDWDLIYKTGDKFKEEKTILLTEYLDDRQLPDKRFIKSLTNKRKRINAGEALELIARAAYAVGEPGVQFDTTINKWHTCPNSGKIRASNPCSEFMFIDDSACNLASINLKNYSLEDRIIDIPLFEKAVDITLRAQETLVDFSSYPSKEIAENSHKFRPLGLGYTNLGTVLMARGLPYDSKEGRAIASAITSLMTAKAYDTSADMAKELGTFKEFQKNKEPMLNVIKKHIEYAEKIPRLEVNGLNELIDRGIETWKRVIEKGEQTGFRNSQVTLLAPTGTIGPVMDVDTTGIEPVFELKSHKNLAGGGSLDKHLPSCVRSGLKTLGYGGRELEEIIGYINKNNTVIGAPHLDKKHYNVFATAGGENSLNIDGHLEMIAAVQPLLSGSISKTVNLPKGSTIKDIKDLYVKAWKLGVKSVIPYVDGSKGAQPLSAMGEKDQIEELKWGDRKKPENPIETYRVNINIGGTGLHFMVGEYNDRPPKEAPADFFVEFGSAGSPYSADITSWAKEASRNRQRGMKLEEFVKHNKGASDPIKGFTDHPYIKNCSGIQDFFAKLVSLEYLGDTSACENKPSPEDMGKLRCNVLAKRRRQEHYDSRINFIEKIIDEGVVPKVYPLYEDKLEPGKIPMGDTFCTTCGSKTILSGANCRRCPNCGTDSGCG